MEQRFPIVLNGDYTKNIGYLVFDEDGNYDFVITDEKFLEVLKTNQFLGINMGFISIRKN